MKNQRPDELKKSSPQLSKTSQSVEGPAAEESNEELTPANFGNDLNLIKSVSIQADITRRNLKRLYK